MTLGNHGLWFRYFLDGRHSMDQVVAFYCLVIWSVPVGLLVSMSCNTQSLPNYIGKALRARLLHKLDS